MNHEIYGGIYSQMIFGESFQEPAPSPAIKGFTSYEGSWVVRDGAVRIDGADGPKLVSDHAAFKDGAVGVELFFADRKGENAGLLVRVAKPGAGADKFIGYEISLDPARQTVRLGTPSQQLRADQGRSLRIAVGRWIPLEVRLEGSVINVLVNGKSVLRHDDGGKSLAAGTVCASGMASRSRLSQTMGEIRRKSRTTAFRSDRNANGNQRHVAADGPRRRNADSYAIVKEKPFIGAQSQQITFESGGGEIGIENQGLNRWGINFVAGKNYEGYIWARAEKPTTIVCRDGESRWIRKYMPSKRWKIPAVNGSDVDFTLTPTENDTAGRFSLKLKQPGSSRSGMRSSSPANGAGSRACRFVAMSPKG